MRLATAAFVTFLLAPATAWAGSDVWSQDLPVGAARTPAAAMSPRPFELVGLHWQGSGRVVFRTRAVSGRWSGWRAAAPEAEDQPDAGSPEAVRRRGWRVGNPYWVGLSDRIDVRTTGAVRRLRAWYVRSPVLRIPLRTVSLVSSPSIVPRAAWGADERIVRATPVIAPRILFAVVHHTAGAASSDPDVSAAIVRGIELYHVKANGWNDIGYNFLVDSTGRVFEGRAGGIERNVVGAHAQGFNTGAVGVAVLGSYMSRGITPAARAGLTSLLAWRLDVAHLDPLAQPTVASGGNPKFSFGKPVALRAISGHRDTGFTSCPGDALYRQLPAIARAVAQTGLPKLYEPVTQGAPGGPVRFTARLSAAAAWTVTVRDAGGTIIAQGSGSSAAVNWTWNATLVPRASYTWTIEAGPATRPAQGTFGAPPPIIAPVAPPAPTLPLLKDIAVDPPSVSPNGDGFADSATLSYTLAARSFVTVTATNAAGAVVATYFTDQLQSAKRQLFPLALDGLPDGRYLLTASARAEADARTGALVLPVVIDRTLAQAAVSSPTLSPNGDGVQDTAVVTFQTIATADVTVRVEQAGVVVATLLAATLQPGPQQAVWDGNTPAGPAAEGSYDLVVLVHTSLGDVRQSFPVALTRH